MAAPNGRLAARWRGPAGPEEFPSVSLTHTDGLIVALAAFRPAVGIHAERIKHRGPAFEESAFDSQECQLLGEFGLDDEEAVARLLLAKEAVAKALGRVSAKGARGLTLRHVDR